MLSFKATSPRFLSLCECNVVSGWNLCYVGSSYLSVCVFIVAIPEEEGDSGGHHVGPQQPPGKILHPPPPRQTLNIL